MKINNCPLDCILKDSGFPEDCNAHKCRELAAYQKGRDEANALIKPMIEHIHKEVYEQGIKKGRADREAEIVENIVSYTKKLIEALNDKEENPILHEALSSTRADEIRIRKLIIEQLKEQTNE